MKPSKTNASFKGSIFKGHRRISCTSENRRINVAGPRKQWNMKKKKHRSSWTGKNNFHFDFCGILSFSPHLPKSWKDFASMTLLFLLLHCNMCLQHKRKLSTETDKNHLSILETKMLTEQEGRSHKHWDDRTIVQLLVFHGKTRPKGDD